MKRILTNNIGYDSISGKKAILQSDENIVVKKFSLHEEMTRTVVFSGKAEKSDAVAKWNKGDFWVLDFSEFCPDADKYYGKYYYLTVATSTDVIASAPFEIHGDVIMYSTLNGVISFIKSQRATGEWEVADGNIGFRGTREGKFDVRGGWWDASGDVGVHLSHLSHGTYFNPQQACFTAYMLYRLMELLDSGGKRPYNMLRRRILDEASYGADWLMRMRAPSKAFFKNGASRGYAFDPIDSMRKIGFEYKSSSYQFGKATSADEEEITDELYESSFRAGGGIAIAALASAARYPYPTCEHSGLEYLQAAKDSYFHLEQNNEKYTNDGKWNLLDNYCALIALVELYKSSHEYGFLLRARDMARKIIDKYIEVSENSGYFAVADGTDQPFFSAADEGLPIVALLSYYEVERDKELKKCALQVAEKNMRFVLDNTYEVANPFGYARIFYQDSAGVRGKQFFFPHNTNVSPWWQGDNARILSLAAAARFTSIYSADADLVKQLNSFADDQIAWVLGLNPYDSCMIEGFGRHNIDYFFGDNYDFMAAPGGIVNGITGGLKDDAGGIEFIMTPEDHPDVDDSWRWAEQWLPHSHWYIYAIALKKA